MQVPSVLVVTLLIDRVGRVILIVAGLLLAGVSVSGWHAHVLAFGPSVSLFGGPGVCQVRVWLGCVKIRVWLECVKVRVWLVYVKVRVWL